MSYRVVIPTAGTGSRLGALTKNLNKSLVSIAHRPTLSHLIEQFPEDCEFVIALGHKGQLVRDFLELAYPHRTFFFAEIDPYEGAGSGLGYSLLCCREYLQQPFIFLSCDTLVYESIPPPEQNWMGYASLENMSAYRTLEVRDGQVRAIREKGESGSNLEAYIGLAGIHDHEAFWDAMQMGGDTAISSGEAHGMRAVLMNESVAAHAFTWYDTGNPEALMHTRDAYREANEPNILEKEDEAIWFVGNHVIKFSQDTQFIANRVQRVQELQGYVPQVVDAREHMYCYRKVEGTIMSEAVTLPLFERLLQHCQDFWHTARLSEQQRATFNSTCHRFYKVKTEERVALFYKNFEREDWGQPINGEPMPRLQKLLDQIDWEYISAGLPGCFHGDFHFENILWSEVEQGFTFIDWRQDFGGDLKVGDIYYDLAKLMHGLIVSHELIHRDQYAVEWNDDSIHYDLHRKQALVECEVYLNAWCNQNGFDLKKVKILTALIYLNIASLHHYPYSLLLYALGKRMLKNELEQS